jgi:hypothetical protein
MCWKSTGNILKGMRTLAYKKNVANVVTEDLRVCKGKLSVLILAQRYIIGNFFVK